MIQQRRAVPIKYAQPRNIHPSIPSGVISFFIVTLVIFVFSFSDVRLVHWFVVPIALCGIVIGVDAVDWVRGKLDVFDPVGLIGLFGVHMFFLSPLLQVLWDHQLLYLPSIADWRPWLGYMALLNLAGIVVYRIARRVTYRPGKPSLSTRVFNPVALTVILIVALVATALLQFYVYYQHFGGIAGYVQSFEESVQDGSRAFSGLGTLFAIAESFPLLVMMAYAVIARKHGHWKSWAAIIAILVVFFALRILFGGLRGSRSNTLYAMVWAVGVIHLYVRPMPRRVILTGVGLGLIFMYFFGFYKSLGSDALEVLSDPGRIAEFERETNRTFELILLSDLSRAGIQAYVLHNLMSPHSDYEYGYGISYLGGLLSPVPDSIMPFQPLTKVELGTHALYGSLSYRSGFLVSTRIYGLAGEALLNFGPLAIPLVFFVPGLFVGRVRTWMTGWSAEDGRRLFLPLLILLCLLLFTNDSDLNAVFLVKQGLVPFVVIWLSSTPLRKTQ